MFLGTFSLFGGVSAGASLLGSAGFALDFGLVPCRARASMPKDGGRSCCDKCRLAVLMWVKLMFRVGNPGSEEDLELKTGLFYYRCLNLENALLSSFFLYYEN